jgi:hypothetical protein
MAERGSYVGAACAEYMLRRIGAMKHTEVRLQRAKQMVCFIVQQTICFALCTYMDFSVFHSADAAKQMDFIVRIRYYPDRPSTKAFDGLPGDSALARISTLINYYPQDRSRAKKSKALI